MTNSEQLERETESCRDELADTLEELRARMTPGEVVDQLVDYAQETTGGLFFQHLKQQVANNPLPVAVMAAGFGWLMFGKGVSASRLRRSTTSAADKGRAWLSDTAEGVAASRREAGDRLSEAGSRARETAGAAAADARERLHAGTAAMSEAAANAAAQAKETMSDATAQVKDAAAQVKDTTVHFKDAAAGAAFSDTVSDTYDRAAAGAGRAATAVAGSASRIGTSAAASGRDFMDFCRDQPLVLAGMGLAVGAAIGALLPRTQAEDQLMGDVSDELKEQTRGFAGAQLEKAKNVGERAYDAAQQQAERQGLSGEAVASEAASRIKDTSIAPSNEADTCSDQTGETKVEPLHERH
jgi:Protein of unknown function (DUF3618)